LSSLRNNTGKISFADFAEIMGEKVLQRDPEEEMKKVSPAQLRFMGIG